MLLLSCRRGHCLKTFWFLCLSGNFVKLSFYFTFLLFFDSHWFVFLCCFCFGFMRVWGIKSLLFWQIYYTFLVTFFNKIFEKFHSSVENIIAAARRTIFYFQLLFCFLQAECLIFKKKKLLREFLKQEKLCGFTFNIFTQKQSRDGRV